MGWEEEAIGGEGVGVGLGMGKEEMVWGVGVGRLVVSMCMLEGLGEGMIVRGW